MLQLLNNTKPDTFSKCGPESMRGTVNVEILARYIFSHISRRDLDAQKFDVSENYNHNRTNRNK